jgi:hypothetical protein
VKITQDMSDRVLDMIRGSDQTPINTHVYICLFKGDPNVASNEVCYTGYERVAVIRSPGIWKTTQRSVSASHDVIFPRVSGSGTMVEFWASSDYRDGPVLYFCRLAMPIWFSAGDSPILTIGMRRSKVSAKPRVR